MANCAKRLRRAIRWRLRHGETAGDLTKNIDLKMDDKARKARKARMDNLIKRYS